jgi:pyruvate formate-lyase/glycerol dehydratase family glycyl radical enzyme
LTTKLKEESRLGSTDRVAKLRDRYMNTTPIIDSERAVLVTRSYRETENEPMVIRRAKALKKVYEEKKLFIPEDQLLLGNQGKSYRCGPMFPEYGVDWLIAELDSGVFYKRTAATERQEISKEDAAALREIAPYWVGKRVTDFFNKAAPEGTQAAIESGALTLMWPIICPTYPGHVLPNYQKLIEKGFMGIKQDAEDQIKKLGVRIDGKNIEKYHFWKATILVCEAGAKMGSRYAALCREEAAKESNSSRKAELLLMAENCERVPAYPARTFWEACQSFFFLEMMLLLELDFMGLSPGRLDQYLYPYYKKDLAEGRITKEEAQELIECLWIKLAELVPMKSERGAIGTGGYSTGQNTIIGGQTKDGKDATNDITYMCLDATKNLMFHEPPLSIRIWNGTPDELWNKAIEVTKVIGGMPSFESDEVIIPGMLNNGTTLEDARNYAIVGCVEPSSPGISFPCCGGGGAPSFVNLPQCLVLALNNGVNPANGKQCGPKTGDLAGFKTFEEVKEAYVKQINHFVDWHVTLINMCETITLKYAPAPLLSMVVDDCVEKGLDVLAGGAKYNSIGTAGVGTANVADALMAIKHFVFDLKKYTGAQLLEAVRTNWEGQETLRTEIMNGASKYGNDEPEVDELARWSTSVFTTRINESMGPRGPYHAGLWPVTAHVMMGMRTPATLCGRKTGEPLADGISPRQGMDKNGPTAIFKSAAALDQFVCYNGTLLNMKFHPTAVRGMEGTLKLRDMIKTYFDMKGMHIQLNVVSADTLRDAQKNPDQYRNLVVRVAGYSAFFVELHKILQDDVIARTEQS